jgi:hypothetical protein
MTEFVRMSFSPTQFDPGTALDRGRWSAEDHHVRVCLDHQADQAWWNVADVLYYDHVITIGVLFQQLRTFPGAAVCAGPTVAGHVAAVGRLISRVITVQSTAPCGGWLKGPDSALAGSLLHAALACGLLVEDAWAIRLPSAVSMYLHADPIGQPAAHKGVADRAGFETCLSRPGARPAVSQSALG